MILGIISLNLIWSTNGSPGNPITPVSLVLATLKDSISSGVNATDGNNPSVGFTKEFLSSLDLSTTSSSLLIVTSARGLTI